MVDRHVLRLQVLRHRQCWSAGAGVRAAAVDPNAGREAATLEGMEVGDRHVALGGSREIGREVDDGDRPLRIHRVVLGGLALVGDNGPPAVGGDRHHVRERPDPDRAEGLPVPDGVEEHQPAVVGLGICLDRHRTEPVLAHRDRVGDPAGRDDRAVVGRQSGGLEVEQLRRALRVGGIQHLDPCLRGVHDQQPLRRGVELHDLCSGLVEHSSVVTAEGVQPECGLPCRVANRVVDDRGTGGDSPGERQGWEDESGGRRRGGHPGRTGRDGHGGARLLRNQAYAEPSPTDAVGQTLGTSGDRRGNGA